MNPLRLEPVYIKSIWAGNRLSTIRSLADDGIGIAREVCAYKGSENKITEGEYKGKYINELIENNHEELMGSDTRTQLIRAAYIDAIEDLSVQVHPNEVYASNLEDYEKSESWYIVEANDGAYISAGTMIEDKDVLYQACKEGTLEQYINKVPVKQGDFALIPAGLLHACGKNMLAIEIGSFGGITYRLYDYGRPRPLDLDKGFEVLDPTLACSMTHHPLPTMPLDQVSLGVEHPLFHVDVIDIQKQLEVKGNENYYILVCVHGSCEIYYDAKSYPLGYTQTMLIPASVKNITIFGQCRLLKASAPSL